MVLAFVGMATFLFRQLEHRADAMLWQWPLLAWFAVALFYLLLLFAGDNGAGAWLANSRFAPLRPQRIESIGYCAASNCWFEKPNSFQSEMR